MKRVLIAFAVALPLVIMGCGKEEALPPHQGGSSTATAGTIDQGTLTPVDTAPQTSTQTTAPPPVTAAPGAVIASTDSEWSGVTLNVTELKRGSGGTVMLRFTIVNAGGNPVNFGYEFTDHSVSGEYKTVGGVHLIDPIGKKKYFVVRDSENKCVCSYDINPAKSGESRNLWAKFPAPPPDVQRVTVVVPHFTPMDDVPIS